ncbi:hypothetical protein DSCA_40100 [Desulfosarcina alkanivorans]|uniref:FAD:protein FMN transferase n=1 Tax=Desulfosarcina alkanivorans TaxID=571177 RepID=A0A5K7YP51_9BACT|nr:hypothetical protein [Desulfosarcina alkanivorans]BBO70080.1 hypothetical protein DSCA_40100 [Desulfosarcina alkanivorans]
MKRTGLKLSIIIALAIVFSAPSCWAKEKGYCYIVSYGLREKTAYITPVFVAKVSGATYSEEEFVADIELIRKMEGQFQNYLSGKGLNTADYVTSARVAYRSQAIAEKYRADEKNGLAGRGYAIKDTGGFKFRN